jgi:hypothetical protein
MYDSYVVLYRAVHSRPVTGGGTVTVLRTTALTGDTVPLLGFPADAFAMVTMR